MNANVSLAPKPAKFDPHIAGLVRAMTVAMTVAMTSDDVESMVNLFAPDGEWAIMATGETFRGLDQIRQLATRSVAGRDHPAGTGIKPTNVFANPDGTKLVWEYVHSCVVTDKWPSSAHRPAPGNQVGLADRPDVRDPRKQARQDQGIFRFADRHRARRPASSLSLAGCPEKRTTGIGDLLIASTLAIGGIAMAPLPASTVLGVLAAAIVFAIVLDLAKVPVFNRLGIA